MEKQHKKLEYVILKIPKIAFLTRGKQAEFFNMHKSYYTMYLNGKVDISQKLKRMIYLTLKEYLPDLKFEDVF